MPTLADFVDPETVRYLEDIIGATTSNIDFGSTNPDDYRGQAESESSPFFDKNLELAKKQLQLAQDQRKEAKQLQERQAEEDFGAFQGIQDRGFARALYSTQSGFAGRGTFTSGFRNKQIGNLQQQNTDVLTGAEREKRQAGESRNLGFEQFIDTSNLDFDVTKLGIERAKEQEILSRQQQLANQTALQNQGLRDQQYKAFDRSLGLANFLKDRVTG